MSEELKPCPFCGTDSKFWTCTRSGDPILGCSDELCLGSEDYETWQNAYCWKEISKLKAELFIARKDVENHLAVTVENMKLKAERDELEIRIKNYQMFFQVAADALGQDPSCDPGKLDPMCTADAIRGLKEDLIAARKDYAEVCILAGKLDEDLRREREKKIKHWDDQSQQWI